MNPLGIDVVRPRFSWELRHSERGRTQSAYQILVSSTRQNLLDDVGDVWDSGKVESDESVNIEYDGKPLESGKVYYWKVRWWDDKGQVSSYSETATFETGLLSQDDWKAKWIQGGDLLRTEFTVDRKVKQARAYICGLGYYELRINGKKVEDHLLDPGWTDYDKLALYSTYDITELLEEGENAVGVTLGNGRLRLRTPPDLPPQFLKPKKYNSPRLILQIHIEFTDGSERTIVSDGTWKVSEGPIVENDICDGETYDARLEKEGWDTPRYDDSNWDNAKIADPLGGKLISQATFPPIKATKAIQPVNITNPKPGVYVYDFGQNFTGWVRLTVRGPRGATVKLRYAELLHPNGTINTATNRGAKATDTYILKGEGIEVYEPRFTYHGFRYVEVTGFPGAPNLDTLQGIVVHSAVKPVGGFACSNQLINSIHRNIIWGQLSNLMSVPTDCPQRDERMGWMGDAQLTVEEAVYNFDMATFYTKWLIDIKEAQEKDGSVPDVVPPYWQLYPADPAWGTACVIIPWYLYLYYGDRRILEENYEVMKRWVDFLSAKSEDYIVKYSKYGDWCPPSYVRSPDTPGELVSTWYYYHDAMTLSKVAHLLGISDEAEQYEKLSEKIKEAFNKKFFKMEQYAPMSQILTSLIAGFGDISELGEISPIMPLISSQTSNILPLFLDMVPEDKEEAVLKKLLMDLEAAHDCHVGTGIVGTRYLLDVLTRYGRVDLAYKLVNQTTYPSWGYMIKEGATTLWERWEYYAGAGMNSHNHIMLGSIDAWFYKALAGINIDPSAPGFKRIIIQPHVVGDLNHVSASVNTIRGLVSSGWRKEGSSLVLEVTLPVNSKGKVSVPDLGLKNPVVKEGGKIVWKDGTYIPEVSGIVSATRGDGYITFEAGSGTYSFWIGESP
ncbi:MAG: family 78 glycoside hydrolase catalytic domain [Candidatus Bathyarchaeia archaeon]